MYTKEPTINTAVAHLEEQAAPSAFAALLKTIGAHPYRAFELSGAPYANDSMPPL
ncbi:hypothetical protein [Pseudoduganella buxea]|uniref:Uncharacterized protein n=1 Tax=Pseudoduganella buxea TaxID=1949069 RepID=A0A6I3ST52_9BURK|nr:hypothetical protein [Pseudoduganella buxea]MTV52353.1 hypothetical protein [Pseudoduganella buxea]GGC06552.1 hypothetical protein GCM10011572_30380 [Pseudoduganella buxea]